MIEHLGINVALNGVRENEVDDVFTVAAPLETHQGRCSRLKSSAGEGEVKVRKPVPYCSVEVRFPEQSEPGMLCVHLEMRIEGFTVVNDHPYGATS
ncbi:hypothetical protein [Desulfurivibrio alkaliphilus]|uniref:Uncharacterized protein n=1 Tax=Desulfurivibrio alkaliphilus (strain DSM 19089 / UNIQEM U267 / AHT2) TaxID=589865 RepID=D6Z692_DESAT|nr:hypothetical protein [Desulfurivibrio alkaliphilus]ADH86857.1 hypothetical protein DaAHT2_2189 [Desulfurivibrio alkaliphilus AHT 2]